MITDLLHFARKVPTVPVQRRIDVRKVEDVRRQAMPRPSWCVLFAKAFALTAQQFPELRRAYMTFPWHRLYEHPVSIASVAVERNYRGENAVFFGHVKSLEVRGLIRLEEELRAYKERPIQSFGLFRRALRMGRLPRPLRRLLWWIGLNSSGFKRAKRMGTFGISVYSGLGAESLHPLSPLTTTLNYGVIENGQVTVRFTYDHRVMDGATVARALAHLEVVMNRDILVELRDLTPERLGEEWRDRLGRISRFSEVTEALQIEN